MRTVWLTVDQETVLDALREAVQVGHTHDGWVDAWSVERRLRSHGLKADARGMGARLAGLVRAGKAERRYHAAWRLWLYRAIDGEAEERHDQFLRKHADRMRRVDEALAERTRPEG